MSTFNTLQRVVALVWCAFCISSGHSADRQPPVWMYDPQSPDAPCPTMPACAAWTRFRAAHPWPYQTFAAEIAGSERTVIISEPPASVTRPQLEQLLRNLFASDLLEIGYNRWPTGVDGWLEDVVLRVRVPAGAGAGVISGTDLSRWEAPAELVGRLRLLHRIFHRTGDGFWVDPLSLETARREPIAELQLPVSDIAGWIADQTRTWLPLDGSSGAQTMENISASKTPGAFRSGGLVAFVAPKGTMLEGLAAPFRRFAVASDLIAGGATMKDGGMILLARSRQIPMAVLPPLRFETLANFARNKSEHLAQSYERQRVFAGKIRTGAHAGWDWAPILLSSQLDDSEFGTLLNLADQILKSWSQHAEVEYFAFGYPKPRAYPFGELSASEHFGRRFQTTSLLFNWNTESVATVTTVHGRDVLTGDRTGALSILYRPSTGASTQASGSRARQIEQEADARAKDARSYFATLGDPILVRVVQNVLLCQAIQSFLTVGDPQEGPRPSRSDQVVSVLEKHAVAWLTDILQRKTNTSPDLVDRLSGFLKESGFSVGQMARIVAAPQSVERDYDRASQKIRTSIREVVTLDAAIQEAIPRNRPLFVTICSTVGGTMLTTAQGERCRWPATMGNSERSVFASYDAYIDGMKRMQADLEAREQQLPKLEQEMVALLGSYRRALELAQTLSRRSAGRDLDRVLTDVLQAAAAGPSSGSIRTPSVVLSKNTVEVEAVGGHNIDFVPRHRVVAPAIGGVGSGGVPPKGRALAELPPPRPEGDALGLRRSGSLLDDMRLAAARSESDLAPGAERLTTLRQKAKTCQCDALVVQGEDNSIYLARPGPPEIYQAVMGKSGLIDALAGPPAAKVVRFENFHSATVENVVRSASFVSAGPREAVWDRAVEALGRVFQSEEARGRDTVVTIERPGRAPELLRVTEAPGSVTPLRQPISLRTGAVTAATRESWAGAFGPEAALTQASDAIIVRFGSQTRPSVLGVAVRMPSVARSGIVARLTTVVQQWVAAQPVQGRPWPDVLIGLREAIRQRIKPADLEFYLKHNQGKIRAAEVVLPMSPAKLDQGDDL